MTKILIDCDPGHDDAVAILYAARHLDLVGITTCHGNNTIENVTRNALSILTLAGLDIPVAQGCAEPLAGGRVQPARSHGKTGLDGTTLHEPDRAPIPAHAVDFIIETASAHRGELVLAVIGPSTNAAIALKREPRLASWLREITIMGGSTGLGNMTPNAEFNVWADPEAASVVLASGTPIRMAGYNVTSRTGANAADVERLLAGPRVARHIGELIAFYRGRQQAYFGLDIAPMHDVCAIVPYVRQDLIAYRHCHVDVELSGRLTRGMTVCDLRTLTGEGRAVLGGQTPNAQVAVETRARDLIDDVIATILGYQDDV